MKDATICFIFREGRILLQKKAPGLFGEGKWNGPGGKIEEQETPEQAAIREVKEETGLDVHGVEKRGVMTFQEKGETPFSVHVFVTEQFSGELQKSPEGELRWFDTTILPYDNMWEDDKEWYPFLLRGDKFRGNVVFTEGFKKMIACKVEKL